MVLVTKAIRAERGDVTNCVAVASRIATGVCIASECCDVFLGLLHVIVGSNPPLVREPCSRRSVEPLWSEFVD